MAKIKKVNLTNKNFFVFVLFFLTINSLLAQIQIASWVVKPPENAYSKPLIYVDFWATWCAPCISSIPHTQGLARQFEDKIFFFFISQETQTKVSAFMKRKKMNFYSAIDYNGKTFSDFNVLAIPHAVILGPSGEILWHGNPSSLTAAILQPLVERYGQLSGKPERIKIIKQEKISLSEYQQAEISGQTLRYIKYTQPVAFDCHREGQNYKCAGSTREILSKILQVYPFQIKTSDQLYWEIITETQPDSRLMLTFFQNQGYHISREEKTFKIYELIEKTSENWLNNKIYNYAENNKPLAFADDSFLIIDNATPEEMARFLTRFSGFVFEYKGQNRSKYDWNIQITNPQETLKFLITELDFRIQAVQKTLPVYHVKK